MTWANEMALAKSGLRLGSSFPGMVHWACRRPLVLIHRSLFDPSLVKTVVSPLPVLRQDVGGCNLQTQSISSRVGGQVGTPIV